MNSNVSFAVGVNNTSTTSLHQSQRSRVYEYVERQALVLMAGLLDSSSPLGENTETTINYRSVVTTAGFYDGCDIVEGFSSYLSLRNGAVVKRLVDALFDALPVLKSRDIKINVTEESVVILTREKRVISESERVRIRPIPSKEDLQKGLQTARPVKEGLTASVVFTTDCKEREISTTLKGYGLKWCFTKDQPKDTSLRSVRVFAEDRQDYVRSLGPSRSPHGTDLPTRNIGGEAVSADLNEWPTVATAVSEKISDSSSVSLDAAEVEEDRSVKIGGGSAADVPHRNVTVRKPRTNKQSSKTNRFADLKEEEEKDEE
jgi:hypothetical protein